MTPNDQGDENRHSWWSTLRHQGVLISNVVLQDIPPDTLTPLADADMERLNKSRLRFLADPRERLTPWLDFVLEGVLGHNAQQWIKYNSVPERFKHQGRRPDRVLCNYGREHQPRLLVLVDRDHVTSTTERGEEVPGRIGLHRGRTTYAQFVDLLRATNVPLGLLTNGHQFRLIYAGLDYEAWTEWDAESWFQGEDGRQSLYGFAYLLGGHLNPSNEEQRFALLDLIKESRERQADLSHVMGTQVREAVEAILTDCDRILLQAAPGDRDQILGPLRRLGLRREDELRALYQAAIRVVMRIVVALYAESRHLFPKSNPIYYDAYSVEGLWHNLRQAYTSQGQDALLGTHSAWPRIQALGRLIHEGSPHPDLPLPTYNGILFRAPGHDEKDEILAALAVLEHPRLRITDATVHAVLDKLKMGQYRVGKSGWRKGVVDFTDLRTEYIGMMYEGLLDYDLREARTEDGGIVVLNRGDQPALPFNVLKNLSDARLKQLIGDLSKKTGRNQPAAEVEAEDDPEEGAHEESPEEVPQDAEVDEVDPGTGFEGEVRKWARRAVDVTGALKLSRAESKDPTTVEKLREREAVKFVARAVPPGGSYLVRWGGSRKGSGTFYTKPGLAFPTVMRVLEPLAYRIEGENKIPKTPDEILGLKICDPAMGSASFLVSAVRYLADALSKAFDTHVFAGAKADAPSTLPSGKRAQGLLYERLLPIRKEKREGWEDRYDAQLKRAIVEYCIYGVDVNTLAVELGKLSLWIETLDPTLKFTFLDHKVKRGNSLVGAWLHEYAHYPVSAWDREAGDGKAGQRTKQLRQLAKTEIKDELADYVRRTPRPAERTLEGFERQSDVERLHESRKILEKLHATADETERERLYVEEVAHNPEVSKLKHLMDQWCSVWYWPARGDVPTLGPQQFYSPSQNPRVVATVRQLAHEHAFFHWELEFPDVFTPERMGFDAVVGNPPWEVSKPSSLEFFTRYRPEFRTYGKQEGLKVQAELFAAQPEIQEAWWDYVEAFRSFSNYVQSAFDPFSTKLKKEGKDDLTDKWRSITKPRGARKDETTYRFQGTGDVNLYKLFAERFQVLVRSGGAFGIISPSGLYSDHGTKTLRELFFNHNNWEWVFSFENRKLIFDIHSAYKFCVSIVRKGGATDSVKCHFMEHELSAWNRDEEPDHLKISKATIRKFSPDNMGILEVSSQRDLEILDKIFAHSVLLKDLPLEYGQDLHMANDSHLFKPREWFEAAGYSMEADGTARKGGEIVAVPLIEGRHIDHFDYRAAAHLEGRGRKAKWMPLNWPEKRLGPNFLVPIENLDPSLVKGARIATMKISSATNTRTLRATILPPFPAGDSISILRTKGTLADAAFLTAVLSSYTCDFVARHKMSGLNLNWFILAELPVPKASPDVTKKIAHLALSLLLDGPAINGLAEASSSARTPIRDPAARAEAQEELDALIGQAYGLQDEEMRWILRPENRDPRNLWRDYQERVETIGTKARWKKPTAKSVVTSIAA